MKVRSQPRPHVLAHFCSHSASCYGYDNSAGFLLVQKFTPTFSVVDTIGDFRIKPAEIVHLYFLYSVTQSVLPVIVPVGSPSRGGDVAAYVFNISQPACPLLFILFMALSTVFHLINSPNNSWLSHSVLLVLFLPYWSFQHLSLYESLHQP